MKRQLAIFLMLFAILLPSALARSGHLTVLAVSNDGDALIGNTADLSLELEKGTGRVFIDTFPLTKIDTQLSTRFAKDIACSYANVDCSGYDFFYTIRADAQTIGGPSGGAALAVLTASVLRNIPLNESVTITGTINSGGWIGPVGGVIEKIEAARRAGLKKVLVPELELEYIKDNLTVNLSLYAEQNQMEIVGVSTLNDAFYRFTGKYLHNDSSIIEINPKYEGVMKGLSLTLCERSDGLAGNASVLLLSKDVPIPVMTEAKGAVELFDKGKAAQDLGLYYSSASYCFGANAKYQFVILELQNLSESAKSSIALKTMNVITAMESGINQKPVKTVTDLETYIIVKDRLSEASDSINSSNISSGDLAYGIERLYSAISWSRFFGTGVGKYELKESDLKEVCTQKIGEAQELYQYITLFLPEYLIIHIRDDINEATASNKAGDYAICIHSASKAKAQANVILSLSGIDETQITELLQEKLAIAHDYVAEQQSFPILGYSYYEYATSLSQSDSYSSLLYAEYALEMSNLEIYFPPKSSALAPSILSEIDTTTAVVFATGVAFGFVLALALILGKRRRRKEKPKKH